MDNDDMQDRALVEAAEWLARQQVGRVDEAAFARWRDRDPANALAFCRVLALWRARIDEARDTPSPPARRSRIGTPTRREMLRAGGVVGIGAVLATGVFVAPAYAWDSATTGVGESRRVILPDGSGAELNTDSRLCWRFSPHERTFWFERGEVCLNLRGGAAAVIRGGPSPIVMSTGRFNMRFHGDAIRLLILDGRVSVGGGQAARPREVFAAAPEDARLLFVSPEDMVVRPATPDQVATTLAWRDHAILFQDVTLESAIAEYNRYLTRKIVIVDPDLAATPVGGRFEMDDPTAFLKAVSLGLGIHVASTDHGYLLTKGRLLKSNNTA